MICAPVGAVRSIRNAMGNNNQKIGISQKVILFRDDGKILALKRTAEAPSRPLRWDLPGGDLNFGEDPAQGIVREVLEETGLLVERLEPFDTEAHINKDGEFWLTIAYKSNCTSDKIKLSYEHNEFKWMTLEEFLKLESADKLKRFVKKFIFLEK